ncbi:ferritin-like domain-containing protein [Hymenobacter negativus]|uniref:Ferritin-like domain-containing protein n=1 Tax=Hymenobacter negativus TaxID=2795026 RepID=A0ABS3QH10_9BACT|nr:ferritin-like domain-containing protein [Hymenobacter negativus]MBO2010531.1 ferritin-like domain-containing protein [Hymenobacter negativus]
MKLISVLDHLAATPTAPEPTPRRALLTKLGRAAAAALPLGLGTAQATTAGTLDSSFDAALQLLQLERLQVALYTQALAAAGLITTAQRPDFERMLAHQTQHAALLQQALQNAGAIVPTVPTFDFSGRHGQSSNPVLFPNVFTSFDDFLALAQQIEDLGVRLYTAHAFNLVYDAVLTRSVLRILPVESQHASHVRSLRRSRGAVVQNWPSEEDAVITRPAAAQVLTTAATGGEETTIQYQSAGVSIPFSTFLTISKGAAIHDPALAESFDEAANTATAQAAMDLFV